MKASIIAVGTELLGSTRVDTNSLLITKTLERYGVATSRKSVVADDQREIANELLSALASSDIVVITGGLGPTEDDVTKQSVAAALGLELHEDPAVVKWIEERFAKRGLKMPESNKRQALVFEGHRTLANPRGSAPGFHINIVRDGAPRHVWIFPGVPFELEGMIEHDLEPWLKAATRSEGAIFRRVIHIVGMAESHVDEKLKPFYQAHADESVTILASRGEIQVHLQARGSADDSFNALAAREREVRAIFGDAIFGTDDDRMECVVGRLLAERGESVATAESCTGGLLASRITDVSGSSAYFFGGVVTYTRDAKLFLLGVDPALIDGHGEVSEPVATQMAIGARRRFGTTYGIGITGIAGPTGGTEKKPVGTVHIAVANVHEVVHRQFMFGQPRDSVKFFSTQSALNMLRLMMTR